MNTILKETIEQMKATLDELSTDNINEVKDELNEYFKIVGVIADIEEREGAGLPFSSKEKDEGDTESDTSLEETTEPENEENAEEPEDVIVEEIEADTTSSVRDKEIDPLEYPLPFSRALTGGFLYVEDKETEDVFVPESIIRDQNIEEGDLVSVQRVGIRGNGQPLYVYEVIQKSSGDITNNRQEFKFAVVEEDPETHLMIVKRDIHHNRLRYQGDATTYILENREIDKFGIEDGSIVDLAWYSSSFDTARVIWQYPMKDVDEMKKTESQRILEHNKKNKNDKEDTDNEEPYPILEGRRICLVGLEPYWSKYKKIVEDLGGELEPVESDRHKVSMSAAIRNSDLVVVGISHTSHEASQHANERAKHYGVPFASMSGYGGQTFLNTVLDNLEEN